jgi:hypothetical protein
LTLGSDRGESHFPIVISHFSFAIAGGSSGPERATGFSNPKTHRLLNAPQMENEK